MPRLRLLLGDDHKLVRDGLRKILEEQADWEIVAEVDNGRSAVEAAITLEPDLAILDIATPQLNGIDATRQIARKAPHVKVLIVSMHADESYVARALGAGAQGYLLKDAAGTDLIQAVEAVASGESYFSPAVSRAMLGDYLRRATGPDSDDPYETLSDREREIFQLVAEGHSNRSIAQMLSISAATVETHRGRILQKLDVHNTAELVLYAVRRGVVT